MALERDDRGVVHVRAEREPELYRGMGYAHAFDRPLQLLMMRILGQGRAAEILDAGLVDTDRFFRRMNWRGRLDGEGSKLSDRARASADAYAAGVNLALERRAPWELRVLGYAPEPWRVEDSFLIARMIGYLSLAQSQGELERVLLEMVKAGVDDARLEDLFPGLLGGMDRALIDRVEIADRFIPEGVRWSPVLPRVTASNNWVVAGSRTASGRPILANDPHLEVNRLPNAWYEIALETPARWGIAATMPGVPGLLLGRTNDLAWGATYTYADATDSWIEEVRDGHVKRGDRFVPLERRTEVIRTKGGGQTEVVFFDTDRHGVLDGDASAHRFRLATRWSGSECGARSLEAILSMWDVTTVERGMAILGSVELSFNWLLADAAGSIGYQMSGLVPVRRPGVSGMVPLSGADPENDWRGFAAVEDLPRAINPPEGFLVTANDDLNALGRVRPISVSMGSYRADRIRELLARTPRATIEDMSRIQMDVTSKQAERFMPLIRDRLADTPAGRALASWDLGYDAGSVGADAFERFYGELFREVFGRAIGVAVTDHLTSETGYFVDFYAAFDRVLLSDRSPWFGGRTRDEVFAAALDRALTATPRPWGERQQIVMRHMLLGGKLPRAFGFDRGPYTLIGGRATPHQGQIYRSGGRATSFAPSIRFATDLGEGGWWSCLAGGPSDRRFSKWYASEVEDWLAGRSKWIAPSRDTGKSRAISVE